MENIAMQDNWVIDIIKLVGLEGFFRGPSREIDHCLISALVEQWRSETHTFHLPHGEMSITLEDVEVILGLPIDGGCGCQALVHYREQLVRIQPGQANQKLNYVHTLVEKLLIEELRM
ncbi:hypothetical protein SO802_002791 [Lithocarpus litseifolius]|uniref:Aminotransferase-like plant mobile domain-containing protein n=1 Tax=Lithocarpus litseifolius TaxID=425828 RepID=A0AAW2E0U7_9ROSI